MFSSSEAVGAQQRGDHVDREPEGRGGVEHGERHGRQTLRSSVA
jgi:hypothetical protein